MSDVFIIMETHGYDEFQTSSPICVKKQKSSAYELVDKMNSDLRTFGLIPPPMNIDNYLDISQSTVAGERTVENMGLQVFNDYQEMEKWLEERWVYDQNTIYSVVESKLS